MVYAATRRECWRAPATGFKFVGSTFVLGLAAIVMTSALAGAPPRAWCAALAAVAGLKLAVELSGFRHLRARQHTALKRSAMLMAGDLYGATWWRFACGALGGVLLPALLWFSDSGDRVFLGGAGIAAFALSLCGELLERYLFFAAATAPKMPGGPG